MSSTSDRPFIHVLFGSQTGNAEIIAMDASDALSADGYPTKLLSMDEFGVAELADMEHVVIVSSTYDDGNMPDSAQDLWDELVADAPDLSAIRYAVLSLGDSSYEFFCAAGRMFDEKLAELGGQRVLARLDCDLDYERPSQQWISAITSTFASLDGDVSPVEVTTVEVSSSDTPAARWTRQNPFIATITQSTKLSGSASRKSVHHVEVDLADSGIEYLPGDSLGLIPVNPTDLVERLIASLGVNSDDIAPMQDKTWGELLTHRLELRLPSRDLLKWVAEQADDEQLRHLLGTPDREAIDAWLWGRDALDLVEMVPLDRRDATRIAELLGSLQHRSYSISSSPTESPKKTDLLVSCVSYHHDGRDRIGAGSATMMAIESGGLPADSQVAVFLAPNPSFRLPADDAPVIMVGPGVGVAPFRSFLIERRSCGAIGKNWLFFGDQHESCDFHYRDEVTTWQQDGLLTELSTAFSRDQEHKVYVQDKLRERGAEVFAWLQDGAHFYICGDGVTMSHSVEAALVEVIAKHGEMPEDAAWDYIANLKRQRRYSQDVY
ncbi:MAG: sulfite reductase flavoprotein subunit alpha [Rhodococcus sp. (in: high G+C Gram-positive bacteria)]|uniref:diflavin oxidoreductase n=1 Tax=Rhodococcus sp. TaxID=1831 RepID=UPI0012013642|nr:sulfite reductase flavoprotein subunit alpha [Rhodococcus sp. (in: high G+C Gram-positive bacteria)]RZL23096.1 MAG: sulfite reductase flavoprotein subunit alpha [Rhodococcus sp. (in: high G+C Gram-positive bacteria)]